MPRALASLLLALPLLLAAGGCTATKRFAYEGFDRDAWQRPDEVLALLGLERGDQVADLGAGSGYFTFRLARAVGPEGRVYAVDVDEGMLDLLAERARAEDLPQVEVVRGDLDDPRLPDGEIDLLFTSNTYHHIEDRTAYFERVLVDLAPKGRVAIVELDDRSWFPRVSGHHSSADAIVEEMRAAGYRLEARHDILERQSFLIFQPDDATGEAQ